MRHLSQDTFLRPEDTDFLHSFPTRRSSDLVKSLSRARLSDPMDCSLPGSSVHGIFQARVLEWGAIASNSTLSYLLA